MALPDGSPESLGSWKFLPALPPTPGGWALLVLRLSFLSPPILSTSPGRAGAAPRVSASLHRWLTFACRVELSVTRLQLRASLSSRGRLPVLAVPSSQLWAVIPRPVCRSLKTQHQFFLSGCPSSQLQHAGSGSLTRDSTRPLTLGAQTCCHWTTREVLRRQQERQKERKHSLWQPSRTRAFRDRGESEALGHGAAGRDHFSGNRPLNFSGLGGAWPWVQPGDLMAQACGLSTV